MEEEAWTCSERNFYSHALTDWLKAFTGAILVSRRDRGQMHASHFSHPPSLLVAEGGLYSRLLWRTAKTNFLVACVAAVACSRTGRVLPFTCLRSCSARGSRLGRGLLTRRNFPDVWYKSKKKEKSSHFDHRTCRDVLSPVLFTFDALVEPVYSHGGWAGLNAPDNSVWKSPQVMTHLVEQACWMEVA